MLAVPKCSSVAQRNEALSLSGKSASMYRLEAVGKSLAKPQLVAPGTTLGMQLWYGVCEGLDRPQDENVMVSQIQDLAFHGLLSKCSDFE